MPTVSFTDADNAAQAEVSLQAAPAAQTTSLAANTPSATTGLEGDFTAKDIRLPRLNLVQKTSDAVDAGFRPGDILFKAGDAIIPLKLPTEATVLNLKKVYQEDVPYGSDIKPRVFDTAQEVRENGGSTEWGAENKFNEMAHIQLLFAAPDDTPEEMLDLFPYEFDGKSHAVAMITLTKSSYTAAAKPVITALMSHLRGKHWHGKWALGSDKKSGGGNSWYVPTLKANGRHTPEFIEFASQFLA